MANKKWSQQTEITIADTTTMLCAVNGVTPANNRIKPTNLGLLPINNPSATGSLTLTANEPTIYLDSTDGASIINRIGATDVFGITTSAAYMNTNITSLNSLTLISPVVRVETLFDTFSLKVGSGNITSGNNSFLLNASNGTEFGLTVDLTSSVCNTHLRAGDLGVISANVYGDFTDGSLNNSLIIGTRGHGYQTELNGDLVMLRTSAIDHSEAYDVTLNQSGNFTMPGVSVNIRTMNGGNILLSDTVVLGSDNSSTPAILPKASTCKGKVITVICNVDDLPFRVDTFAGDSMFLNGYSSTSTSISISPPYNSKTFISDGILSWFQI